MIDDLLTKAKEGDKKAEEDFFNDLIVRFRNFATFRVGEDHAEDIAIEACRVVFQKYKTVKFSPNFDAWAHGVFKNVLRNYTRKLTRMKREVSVEDESDYTVGSTTSSEVSDLELRLTLIQCLEKMMERNIRYTMILKRVYQGHSTNEICEELGIKLNNFHVTLSRSRVMLKRCLEAGSI